MLKSASASPETTYRIRHGDFLAQNYTHLSKEEAFDLFAPSDAGLALLHIEETYDVVIANFIALEEIVLGLAARQMAGRHNFAKLDFFAPARRECHRALFNLLSAARAFDEQARSVASRMPATGVEDLAAIKSFFSREYDASLGYRAVYALRNHSQHQGMSVTGVVFGRQSVGVPGATTGVAVTVRPFIHMDELRRSEEFSKKTLAELEKQIDLQSDASDEKTEILPHVRQYVQGLSRVLDSIRQHFAEREAAWRRAAEDGFRLYGGPILDPRNFGLAVEVIRGGRVQEDRWVGVHPWPEIEALRTRNIVLSYLDRAAIMS